MSLIQKSTSLHYIIVHWVPNTHLMGPHISVCLEPQLPPWWYMWRMWPTARCAVYMYSIQIVFRKCYCCGHHVLATFIEVIMSSCMNQGGSLDAHRDVSWWYWLATLGRIWTHEKDKSSCLIPASTYHVERKMPLNTIVESGDRPLEQYVEYFSLCVVCIFCECSYSTPPI